MSNGVKENSVDKKDLESFRHSDGSDCIGCSPPPRLQRQAAVVDLEASSEDWSASQSQESQDASDSFLPSIPEDEEEAMEDVPVGKNLYLQLIEKQLLKEQAGKSNLN